MPNGTPFLLRHFDIRKEVILKVISPWSGKMIVELEVFNEIRTKDAVNKCIEAFDVYKRTPSYKKAEYCFKISSALLKDKEEIAKLITEESGKPIKLSRSEVERAATTFQIAGEEAKRIGGEIIPLDITPASENFSGMALDFPLGPVLAISPFNFPLNLVAHKIAPALAAGCSVFLKPANKTPLTALRLLEIIREAGVPEGVVTVGLLNNESAEKLVRDERFKLLTFTGSDKVGWHLKSLSGKKKVLLELGGNAPALVHKDADISHAVQTLVNSAFAAGGQVCIKAQRLLIHTEIYSEFMRLLTEATEKLPVGDPFLDDTMVGPLIDEESVKRVEQWVAEAISGGAKLVTGGKRDKNIYYPTILKSVPSDAKVRCLEVFGPVVIVDSYDDFSEALQSMNGNYGLQAAVYTYDIRLINQAVQVLEYGGVVINNSPSIRVDNFPYGGIKDSGFGREGVRSAIKEMCETKMVVMQK